MSETKIAPYAEEDREDVAQYRTPSVLAVLTLVLGSFSFLALFKPMLWIFPVITLCVGFTSLYALAQDPLKVGRKITLIGLVLAFFFLAWGSSHYFLRRQWLAHHARQYADAWLELVRAGQLQDAHQLHLRKASRVAEGVTIEDYYAKHPYAQPDYQSFYDRAPLKQLIELGPSATIVFERVAAYDKFPTNDTLQLDYRAEYVENGRSKQLPVRIVMARDRDPAAGEFNWCVERIVAPDMPLR